MNYRINKKFTMLIISSIIFMMCTFIIFFILTTEFDSNSILTQQDTEDIGIKEVILIGVSTYAMVFFIFLITVKNYISKVVFDIVYKIPKKGVIFVMDADLRTWAGAISFFVLSFIITAFSFYFIIISTTDGITSLIPGTEWIQIQLECKTVGQTIEDFSSYTKFFILLIGPISVFTLRQIRSYEIRNLIPKYQGARSLTIFFFIIIALFIADNIFEIGCNRIREPGLYAIPDPPVILMYKSFSLSFIYGALVVALTYMLELFVIPIIRKSLID